MAFSNFRLNVLVRVLLLGGSLAVATWGWTVASWVVTPLVAAGLALLFLVALIRYVERAHRELAWFLGAVAHGDYSVPVSERGRGRAFDQLEHAYRTLRAEFIRLNTAKAANHQHLEAVVEHVGVALVCFGEAGEVTMLNEPARRLLGMPHVNSWSSLARFDERLPALLQRLRHGDRELLQARRGDERLQLILYATEFTLLEKRYKLVSLQDIRDELEGREVESWQKLTRVLTHEIMNSVTPIVSLTHLMQETLADHGPALDRETHNDLLRSASAVHSRGSGLLQFVQAYRSFTALPAPAIAPVPVRSLLEGVRTLMADALQAQGVSCEIRIEGTAPSVLADRQQIEQVLINLMRNAIEVLAGTSDPRLTLQAGSADAARVRIQVIDNGPGVEPANVDSIFVPFFTTRRGGSGIGLSISRQLMHANRGFIAYHPGEPRGSVFTLLLAAAAS
jgi:nitrogen fixation/metabolism regulation signal transduction histidine kinase